MHNKTTNANFYHEEIHKCTVFNVSSQHTTNFVMRNSQVYHWPTYNYFYYEKFTSVQLTNNKTIKDGGIAPWLIWNNLSTWPYQKIWTKRKEKNTEKRLNHKYGDDGWAFPLFAASLCAFGAQAECMQYVFSLLFCLFVSFKQYPNKFKQFLDSSWPFPDKFLRWKVLKSTQKYSKVLKSTKKYQKVPKSTQKYSKVPKIPKSTQKSPKVPKSTQKY